jgi:ketosteroid isomerase-like protein
MVRTGAWLGVVWMSVAMAVAQTGRPPQAAATAVVTAFEAAVEKRDLEAIEAVVDPAIVVFENGHRNDGWVDFRDNHLKPELAEPAPPMQRELVKVSATEEMAWAYSRATFTSARGRSYELWSVYVVAKKNHAWKIVMLDWSMRAVAPSVAAAAVKSEAPGWTVEKAQEALAKAGLSVRKDVKVEQPYLKAPGTVLVVGKEAEAEIQVYVYPSMEARKRDSDTLDPEKATPPTVSAHWMMPVSVVSEGNMLAIVLTRDEGLRKRIREALASGK